MCIAKRHSSPKYISKGVREGHGRKCLASRRRRPRKRWRQMGAHRKPSVPYPSIFLFDDPEMTPATGTTGPEAQKLGDRLDHRPVRFHVAALQAHPRLAGWGQASRSESMRRPKMPANGDRDGCKCAADGQTCDSTAVVMPLNSAVVIPPGSGMRGHTLAPCG